METKSVMKVVGYNIKMADGNFIDSCVFWIYAETSKEAIKKAKLYGIEKKEYEVLEVVEKTKDFDAIA